MSLKIKICGITNTEDALAAADAGADALGFMFYEKSLRHVSEKVVSKMASRLSPFILKVGVFVDPEPETVFSAIRNCDLNLLQFHGDESPEFCQQFGLMAMKAFRMTGPESLRQLSRYNTEAWLLDSHVAGKKGGTGEQFDWSLAREAIRFGKPVFLAGGLTPANVAKAVEQVRPYGVDVSSGVEISPGKKDPRKIRDFITAARSVPL